MADLSPKRVRTGNDKLRVEGAIEKAVGAVQNAAEEAQDKAGNALKRCCGSADIQSGLP